MFDKTMYEPEELGEEKEKAIIEGFKRVLVENSFEDHSDTSNDDLAEAAWLSVIFRSGITVKKTK